VDYRGAWHLPQTRRRGGLDADELVFSGHGALSYRPCRFVDMPRALGPEKREQARRLREQGTSLNKIAKALGISYGSAHRFTAGICPEKERSPETRGSPERAPSMTGHKARIRRRCTF
jgi:hypothetical protein